MSGGPFQGRGHGGCDPVPVAIRGVGYPSIGAAALALGVAQQTIRYAMRHGADVLDRVGLRAARNRGVMPVIVRGQDFASVADCAAHFRLRQSTVYKALADGRADGIGLGRGANLRARAAARRGGRANG